MANNNVEQHMEYISTLIEAIIQGFPVQIMNHPNEDCYFLTVETEEEIYYLEIKKDNRFGKNLDS